MKVSDQYHKRIEWSDEDQIYIGKCPDFISGKHGYDPVKLYGELCEVIEDVVNIFKGQAKKLVPMLGQYGK